MCGCHGFCPHYVDDRELNRTGSCCSLDIVGLAVLNGKRINLAKTFLSRVLTPGVEIYLIFFETSFACFCVTNAIGRVCCVLGVQANTHNECKTLK